jgi:hypothetical protein
MVKANQTHNQNLIGYYSVNGIAFDSKINAMKACAPGEFPTWHFMENCNPLFDWTKEPVGSLTDWYRKRAEQIRNKYDRVLLLFSGGIDSVAVLRTFVDNNIPLDGIISYGSFSIPDYENYSRNQEVVRVAIPYVQELAKKRGIKLDHYLLDDVPLYSFYDNESWAHNTSQRAFSPEVALWGQQYRDRYILNHCEAGNTVLLRGTDKPRVAVDNGQWKINYLDLMASLYNPWVKTHDNLYYDFFFWTPDMPEVTCKQAHTIRNYLQENPIDQETFTNIFTRQSTKFNHEIYYQYIDPIIYKDYISDVPGQQKSYFSVGKSSGQNLYIKEDAFMTYATAQQKQNWLNGINHIANQVDLMYYNGAPTEDNLVQHFLTSGIRCFWSKDFNF